jgi:hypothetical protein
VSWDAIGSLAMVALTIAGLNAGTVKWLLDRQRQSLNSEATRWNDLERGLYELRASLPLEYVRREDWIRFSGTLDAKLDAIRNEMREETEALKDRLYGGRD